jgi:class 3 adenylate cyclase/predicted ATPase
VDIAAWLRELGLERYEEAFRANDIDVEILRSLTADDLKELGIASLGHRKKLLEAIVALTPATAPPRSPAARSEAERRQLTVLFCDLVGSTELSARLDPEDMAGVIRNYHSCCSQTIESWGGHVAKYMGDGVLAYFGWPQAHEDEAERAVRAGLTIVKAVGELATPVGVSLAARVGIATGLVMVGELIGEGAAQEQAVVGETPNLAARLQALADVGKVVISQATRRLVGSLFELADLGPQRLKGFAEPLVAFRVEGEGRAEGRFEALHGERLTPLIGREHELGILLERWSWARDGDGQVVLLSGEPGIGKSRLTRGLIERLADEPHTRLRYYCSPYHTNSALFPVIEQLERAAAFRPEDAAEIKLDKLEAVLAEATEDLAETAPLISALLSVSTGARYPPLDLTPQAQKLRTFEALLGQAVGLAERRPVLMVLEDAHWIDPTTAELFGLVIDRIRHLPALLLITFRPEFTPPWTGHTHVTSLALSRLGQRQGAQMVERLTGNKPLPAEVLKQILLKTEGVPLFVEELTKTVLESGLLTDAGDRYELAGPLPPLAIPTTLHDSLMARLDRLAPVKEVAQIGAVIGREFSHELLAAVAPMSANLLGDALEQLVSSELIFRRGTPPDATYSFKHALVRDAAYQSLLKSRRQQLHAGIAEALEERFPDTARIEPEVLAQNYTAAGLSEQAVAHWQRAAEHAARRSANLEAIAHLTKGLELLRDLPRDLDHQRLELDMQIALGGTLVTTKGWTAPETAAAFGRARELCELSGDSSHLIAVDWGEYTVHLLRGELDRALQKTQATLRHAEGDNDVTALLMAHRTVGPTSVHLGHMEQARAHLERALAFYDPEAHAPLAHRFGYDARVVAQAYLSHALLHLGYPDQALATARQAVEDARRLAHAFSLCFAMGQLGIFHQVHDDLPPNAGMLEELIVLCSEQGFSMYLAIGLFQRGFVSILSGRTEAGLSEMQRGLSGWQRHSVKLLVPLLFIQLAKVDFLQGHPEAGLDRLAEALAMIEETGECWHQSEACRLKGELLLSLPEPNAIEAEAAFARAIDVAHSQSGKWPELRAATALARLWAERGERQKAHDLLAPVYDWFTEGFDTADLKDAKALLDQLA